MVPSTMSTVRPRPTALLALAAALLLAALIALPAPARAHDTLISTDPADGTTLPTSPEQINLTFSGDLLDVSPLVRIVTEDGALIEEITPTVEGPVATAVPSQPLPRGTQTVQWRVVSGDGHPIEGSFALTIEEGPDAPEGAGEAAGAGSAAGTEGEEPAEEGAVAAEQDAGGGSVPLLLGGLVVLSALVGVAAFVIMRPKRPEGPQDPARSESSEG